MELGKATSRRIQAASSGSTSSASPATAFSRDVSVPWDIVARHDGERREASLASALEAGDDQPKYGLRRIDVSRVENDVRMRGIESLGGGGDVIAALRDRQRNDADLRPGESVQSCRGIAWGDEVDHRTDHASLGRVRFLLDDRRQPILLAELLPDQRIGGADACADHRPIVAGTTVEEIVEIDGLMRAMKIADAKMKDARAEIGASVFGNGYVGREARQSAGG